MVTDELSSWLSESTVCLISATSFTAILIESREPGRRKLENNVHFTLEEEHQLSFKR